MRAALDRVGLALVQMVTPVTPAERLKMLCEASQGFVYAVTMTGTTGQASRCRRTCSTTWTACAPSRRCRSARASASAAREQVARMHGHVDGVVVGSALVEVLERGEDPAAFITHCTPSPPPRAGSAEGAGSVRWRSRSASSAARRSATTRASRRRAQRRAGRSGAAAGRWSTAAATSASWASWPTRRCTRRRAGSSASSRGSSTSGRSATTA